MILLRSGILKPNAKIQKEMLVNGLSEILLRASEGKEMFVLMQGPKACFEGNSNFGIDGFTEKVEKSRKLVRTKIETALQEMNSNIGPYDKASFFCECNKYFPNPPTASSKPAGILC